jgi:hypothetical protein
VPSRPFVLDARMSALKLVLWGFLAVLGSVALAFVVGLVNPQEKVNGLGWSRRRLVFMCWLGLEEVTTGLHG